MEHTTRVMNAYQALRILNVNKESSQDEIRAAYRKMALELHPDKNSSNGAEFKKVTEAYNYLKSNQNDGSSNSVNNFDYDNTTTNNNNTQNQNSKSQKNDNQSFYSEAKTKNRAQWGAGPQDGAVPEQDWSKFTKHVEDEDPNFWKEYERKFWEDYNARIRPDGKNGEYEKASEPDKQPSVFVDVDKSLCIGCCSCEIIAPDVFEINKQSMMNPKSSVINQRGAGINKIMNAAETCPTKAIRVENTDTKERLFPY